MDKEYARKLARAAITHDFDIAYGLLRLISRDSREWLDDPDVGEWIKKHNKILVAIIAFNSAK